MKKLRTLSTLQILLFGGFLAIVSGLIIRPFNESAHTGVVVVALAICLYAIVKSFRR
ncbi:MAG TPA: hypothetical protein VGB50_01975 [Flavobacterium sp.]